MFLSRAPSTLVAAAILSLTQFSHAQTAPAATDYTWKSVKISAGGFITGIVFSPKEAGLAYLRTDIGGAYRYDTKLKQWVCLTDWVGPRNNNLGGCESVASDPTDPEKIYLALGTYSRNQAAIARSSDRGITFQITNVPCTMGGNEDGRGMGERLAVDPSDPRTLYFASRHDGLWRSADAAVTWAKVAAFPIQGAPAGRGAGGETGAGLTWVLYDPRSDQKPTDPTASIYIGVAGGAASSIYHSPDAGKTWRPLEAPANTPPITMMPHHALIEPASHTLFIAYGNGPGPNNVTAGAVYKYQIDTSTWTNITPNNPGNGGYGGLAIDRQHPNTLMVTTIDHWGPADDIFRTTDAGLTWKPIAATANRDTTGVPYMANLLRGHRFDWWLAALAIDPFDSNHVLFGTGATVWGTHNITDFDATKPTQWRIEADGIEETAVLALASPAWGTAHLISGVGDIGGFTHDDLTLSPTAAHDHPMFSNTTSIEIAELKPVVVRTGTANRNGGGQTAAYSEDGGHTWTPLQVPGGSNSLILNADGTVMLATNPTGIGISKDRGQTWTAVAGLSANARIVADRIDPKTFYALDIVNPQPLLTSIDGGATFTAKPSSGLPNLGGGGGARGGNAGGGGRSPLKSSFANKGELWLSANGTLFHSTDAGATFQRATPNNAAIQQFSLGKPAPNHTNPALFATGTIAPIGSDNTMPGIFRSDDNGATWLRINDDQHQFGGNPTVIAADPRVFGRLFIGMNGRGILVGEPK